MAAGLGFKTFATGDVLSAADTNGYLMQGVLVFASATARDAAITSPQEGQACYLKDTDVVQTYSGSAWVTASVPTSYGNAAGKNAIINGGMDIWQRGTSFAATANGTYLQDRWYNTAGTVLTVTQDADVPTDPYFNYSAKIVCTATASFATKIESANSTPLAGKTVTFSLYAKKTSGTGGLNLNIYYPSAKDNFTSVTQIGSALVLSASPSSSWTRYSVTVTLPSNVTNGLLCLIDNANAGTIFITGVQLELGSTATTFSRTGASIQGELAACQIYYYRSSSAAGNPYSLFTQSFGANSTTQVYCSTRLPVTMRVAPTAVEYANLQVADGTNLTAVTTVAIDNNTTTQDIAASAFNVASGLTQYRPYAARGNNSSSAYLAYTAEL